MIRVNRYNKAYGSYGRFLSPVIQYYYPEISIGTYFNYESTLPKQLSMIPALSSRILVMLRIPEFPFVTFSVLRVPVASTSSTTSSFNSPSLIPTHLSRSLSIGIHNLPQKVHSTLPCRRFKW